MRMISFALTEEALLASAADVDAGGDGHCDGGKWVTRRVGWANLRAGERLKAVRKAMGLKRGESPVVLCEVEVVSVKRQALASIGDAECVAEGFPHLTPAQFVEMFCEHHAVNVPDEGRYGADGKFIPAKRRLRADDTVTRIEFRVVPGTRRVASQATLPGLVAP